MTSREDMAGTRTTTRASGQHLRRDLVHEDLEMDNQEILSDVMHWNQTSTLKASGPTWSMELWEMKTYQHQHHSQKCRLHRHHTSNIQQIHPF